MHSDCAILDDLESDHGWNADANDSIWEKTTKVKTEWYRPTKLQSQLHVKSSLETKFAEAAERWRSETKFLSSSTDIVLHPAYQDILGMGKKALPLIFRELASNGGRWFWALRHITGEDPVNEPDKGKTKVMTEAWLKWAKNNHYL
jgi:hypothetical protein